MKKINPAYFLIIALIFIALAVLSQLGFLSTLGFSVIGEEFLQGATIKTELIPGSGFCAGLIEKPNGRKWFQFGSVGELLFNYPEGLTVYPNGNLEAIYNASTGGYNPNVGKAFRFSIDNVEIQRFNAPGSQILLGMSGPETSGGACLYTTQVGYKLNLSNDAFHALKGGYYTMIYQEKNPEEPDSAFRNNIGFRFYKEDSACSNTSNYVLKIVPLNAGQVVSFNYSTNTLTLPVNPNGSQIIDNPIFCHSLPVIKQKADNLIEQDYFPYDSLTNGGTITVPAGEVWLMFYKTAPSSSTLTLCDNGSVYDAVNNKCIIQPTIEYTCLTGQFNPDTKTCVTQANSEIICADNTAVYNQGTGKCEKIITDILYICPSGFTLSNKQCLGSGSIVCPSGYSLQNQVCIKQGNIEYTCPTGFTLTNSQCFGNGTIACPSGYELSNNVCFKYAPLQFNCPLGSSLITENNVAKCVSEPATELRCSRGILIDGKCVIEATPNQTVQSKGISLGAMVFGILATAFAVTFFIKRRK